MKLFVRHTFAVFVVVFQLYVKELTACSNPVNCTRSNPHPLPKKDGEKTDKTEGEEEVEKEEVLVMMTQDRDDSYELTGDDEEDML